jgi:hypothetical protein
MKFECYRLQSIRRHNSPSATSPILHNPFVWTGEKRVRITDVTDAAELQEFMTTPTDRLVEFAADLEGDLIVLGAGGKMGPDLVETFLRANAQCGVGRTVYAVSRFSDPEGEDRRRIEEAGGRIIRGDLTEEEFLQSLPDVPNVIFMVGYKFGSSGDWRGAFHINAILPYLVGRRFGTSRIVAFSSTNPYPHVPLDSGGADEETDLDPQGPYGWGIVARESAFRTSQMQALDQTVLLYRLAYAQHLGYGVLVDLARMLRDGEPISLAMPAVNLVSQRDAIDVALRSLSLAGNPAEVLNCCGPVLEVRGIVERMAEIMEVQPLYADEPGQTALISSDEKARRLLGEYRDRPGQMIEAAARWVMRGGEYWDLPTKFGKADHRY